MVLQIEVLDAWKILQENPNSILIDVRTKEEIEFVGFVDQSKINGKIILLPWKNYPQMSADESFTDKLSALIAEIFPSNSKETQLLFLCRSGNRSLEAALFMSDFGYNCYNIINGFEGSHNDLGQRGKINGWKAQNLPWRQN
ncbi:MAG: rhodanese-like domain-containing protein [Pseudomonadota bacterium]